MERRAAAVLQDPSGTLIRKFGNYAVLTNQCSLQTRRLTPEIRRHFILTLRTPVLLSMFSKDPFTISYSQAAIRAMALLEPNLVMPEILERAYSGLEVVNETHRTTAVMTMLSAVSLPLVSERFYVGGQKHVVPLLELCIPGIDLVC